MRRNTIPPFVGVIVSFIAIWLVNDFVMVDKCLANNGSFLYESGECLLASGETIASPLGKYLIALYFFMGLIIALFTSVVVRKIFKIAP
jgi:hypothetical protein